MASTPPPPDIGPLTLSPAALPTQALAQDVPPFSAQPGQNPGIELRHDWSVAEIEAARPRVLGTCVRTPLVKLELGAGFPDIRLKLENLQPINAYKLRGAANAVALLSEDERAKGVWTISAGNAGHTGSVFVLKPAEVPPVAHPGAARLVGPRKPAGAFR